MMLTTGYYINLAEKDRGIYIILNEANDAPTCEEISKIQCIVEKQLSKSDSRKALERAIEEANLSCIAYGFSLLRLGRDWSEEDYP